jgi:hypothetical protein
MPLHAIFDEAPRTFADDFTFRVRLGSLVNGRPMTHDTFRFTTGDMLVADDIAETFGGVRDEWETKSEEVFEVLSTTKRIDIILESVRSEYVLWGRGNAPIRTCDGISQSDDQKSPCACAQQCANLADWKAAAKQGTACQPTVKASFRLADLPDIGLGRFQSSSWGLAMGDPAWTADKMDPGRIWQPPIGDIEEELSGHGGRAMATLEIVGVEFTTRAGKHVSYNKPQITVTGPVHEAVDALLTPA